MYSDDELLAHYLDIDAELSVEERHELVNIIRRITAELPPVEPDPIFREALGRRLQYAYRHKPLLPRQNWAWPVIQMPWTPLPRSIRLHDRVTPLAIQNQTGSMPIEIVPSIPQHRNRIELLLGAAVIAGIAWWVHNHPESIRLPQLTNREAA